MTFPRLGDPPEKRRRSVDFDEPYFEARIHHEVHPHQFEAVVCAPHVQLGKRRPASVSHLSMLNTDVVVEEQLYETHQLLVVESLRQSKTGF